MSTEPINNALEHAIKLRHPKDNWFLYRELRTGTGWAKYAEQRLDYFAMHQWPSRRFERHVYEMKATRADFRTELKKPRKRRLALRFSNYFWFITPPGIAKEEEIPGACGLIEVPIDGHGKCKIVIPADYRDTVPPTWLFMAAVCRHVQRLKS